MKAVLFLALAISCVCATQVESTTFSYSVSNWFTTVWNSFILSILLPFYIAIGSLFALFGQGWWLNDSLFVLFH